MSQESQLIRDCRGRIRKIDTLPILTMLMTWNWGRRGQTGMLNFARSHIA